MQGRGAKETSKNTVDGFEHAHYPPDSTLKSQVCRKHAHLMRLYWIYLNVRLSTVLPYIHWQTGCSLNEN